MNTDIDRAVALSKGQQKFFNGVLIPRIAEHFNRIDPMYEGFDKDIWKEYLWRRFGSPCGDCAIQAIVDWCDELDISLDNA
jgi:hypothetical protein